MSSTDELLRPSLGARAASPPIYSTTTAFLSAFLGGPFGAIFLTALNSSRLKRNVDLVPLTAAFGLTIAIFTMMFRPDFLGVGLADQFESNARILIRAYSLGLFGLFWCLHRRYYRGMAVLGLQPPNGLGAGLGCIVIGTAAERALIRLLTA